MKVSHVSGKFKCTPRVQVARHTNREATWRQPVQLENQLTVTVIT